MSTPVYSAVPFEPDPPRPQTEAVLLQLSKQGRAGKSVTELSRLRMHPQGKEELLKKLKTACGAGGTVKDGVLEIQGDQRAKLKVLLEKMGYKVKGA